MNTINAQAKKTKYCFKINIKFTEKLTTAFKKYCTENLDMILASLAVMNGNVPYHYYEMHKRNS